MTIQEIHNVINFLVNQEQGAYFSNAEIDQALDVQQIRELQKYFGDDRAAQQGNLTLMYKSMQHVHDAVSRFEDKQVYAVTAGINNITFRTDQPNALYITGVTYQPTDTTKRGGSIPIVISQEYASRLNSAVYSGVPMAKWNSESGEYECSVPLDGSLNVHFIDRPAKPEIDGTPSAVELNWKDDKQIDIIYLALQMLGLNSLDKAAIEFAMSKSNPQV